MLLEHLLLAGKKVTPSTFFIQTWGSSNYGQTSIIEPQKSWSAMSSGARHVLALTSAKELYVWGSGRHGALGLGDSNSKTTPTKLDNNSWIAISAGQYRSHAIRSDGTLWAWGYNNSTSRPLGQPDGIHRSSPVQIGAGTSFIAISTTGLQSQGTQAAVSSTGKLWVWGGPFTLTPTEVDSGNTYTDKVAVYPNGVLAIRTDGTMIGMGSDVQGALGTPGTQNPSTPAVIGSFLSPPRSWTQVSAKFNHALALTGTGELFTFGYNQYGQLGSPYNPISWTAVAKGRSHQVALNSSGNLFVWGTNSSGVGVLGLGISETARLNMPTQLGTSSWTAISAGNFHTLAIRADGTLWAWGSNSRGQLGLSDFNHRSSPVQIGTSSWTSVKAQRNLSHAIRNDGALFSWGENPDGLLGLGDLELRSSPTQVGTSSWTAVGEGIGILSNGRLAVWGVNDAIRSQVTNSWTTASFNSNAGALIRSDGALFTFGPRTMSGHNLGPETPAVFPPERLGTSSWTAVQVGLSHMVAIRSDGALFTWGQGNYSRLGLGDLNHRSSPVQVGTSSWTAIACTRNHTLAIRADGTLWGWGDNNSGKLGLGDQNPRSSPVQIGTSLWSAVAAGLHFSLAIRQGGSLFAWGSQSVGQLGNGVFSTSGINVSSPTQIGSNSWTTIHAFNSTAAGIRGGTLFTWGYNTQGQLGDGTTAHRSSPVQIGSSSWSVVRTTGFATSAISGGRLFAWGLNNTGYLGVGDQIHRSSPVQVSGTWQFSHLPGMITNTGVLYGSGVSNIFIGSGVQGANTPVRAITTRITSPILLGTSSWTAVSSAYRVSAAIRSDGALFTWGRNDSGQLGHGDLVHRSSPTQVGTSSWIAVNAGYLSGFGYSLGVIHAIRQGNALFGMGLQSLTGENTSSNRSSPVQIGTSSWIAISSSNGSSPCTLIGLTSGAGNIFTWGDFLVTSPVSVSLGRSFVQLPVKLGTSSWTAVSAGNRVSMAIRSDGGLFTWGLNGNGQLGLNDLVSRSSPVQVGTSSWSILGGGPSSSYRAFSGAIDINSALYIWGYTGTSNPVALSPIHRSSPVLIGSFATTSNSPVQLGTSSWSVVSFAKTDASYSATRGGHAAAIRSDGALFTWGLNDVGQLGHGDLIDRISPVQVGSSSWTAVSCGSRFTAAIRSDRRVWTWGSNTYGQLGHGSFQPSRSSPVQVGLNLDIKAIAAAPNSMLALASNGRLFGWGRRGGNFQSFDQSNPVQVQSPNSFTVIAAGGPWPAGTTMAIRSTGELFSSGAGNYGILGNGFTNTSYGATPVSSGTSGWTAVTVGRVHAAGIRNGVLYTWGSNSHGELGLSDNTHRSTPAQVGSDSWVAVAAGDRHTLGIRNTGQLFSWGRNSDGQLGLSDTIHRSSPTQVGTGSSWVSVWTGSQNSGGGIKKDDV